MISRITLFALVLITTGAFTLSCSSDIPDCPSRMCIVAGGWVLIEVYIDGEPYTGDISQYSLLLDMPTPTTSTTASFNRTQPSGEQDNGVWSLQNNETILRLVPNDNQLIAEDWIIESMTPRNMVLIMNRDIGIKDGPSTIEFVLQSF